MSLRHYSFTVIWALLILLLYGIPGGDMPSLSLWKILEPDKVAHAGVFVVLMCSMTFSNFKQNFWQMPKRRSVLVSALMCAVYGTVLELIQGAVFTDRHTDVLDILANLIGVVLGIVILKIFFRDILT